MDKSTSASGDRVRSRTAQSIDDSTAWLEFVEECDRALSETERTDPKEKPTLSSAIFEAASRLRNRTPRLLARLLITRLAETLATSADPATTLAGAEQVARVLGALSRADAHPQAVAPDSFDPRVTAVLEFIESSHSESTCRLDHAARELRLSRSHLGRLILKETGITFNSHLRLARMSTAARLLQETDLTIKEVSSGTGYEHVPSFDRQFRSHFNLTPGDFRRVVRLPQFIRLAQRGAR